MASLTFDDINTSNNRDGDGVGFFSLKKDGEEAIVRIMCDDIRDLDIFTVHPITVQPSSFPNNRQVNCIRDPRDPMDMCPLCASGESVKQKVFIKMIQYDETTKEGKPVVWDRHAGVFGPKIKSYIDNYGPLSNIMCKIIRHGSGRDTTYDIIPNINPQFYNETNFPKMPDAFNEFKVLGRMIYDKTAEEMIEFINTGKFPEKVSNTTNTTTVNTPRPTPEPIPNGYAQPYDNGFVANGNDMERPNRYY